MAELSPDSQAIVDRLKSEGNLVRNSGTHSIRSVKIQLDKFEEIFKTISNNISLQNDVLKIQTDIVKADAKNSEEESERARAADEFEKLEPQDRSDRDDDNSAPLVTEAESKKIDDIGDSIRNALSFKSMLTSFKNVALAGAGLFVGYNFIKGFIDEKTGGGFTEFEKNIGPFAKSLPIIGKALTDFPGTLAEMRTSIQTMSTSVTDFVTDLRETLQKFSTPLAILTGVISAIGLGGLGGLARLAAVLIDKFTPSRTPPATGPGGTRPPAGPGGTPPPGPRRGGRLSQLGRAAGSAVRMFSPIGIAATVGMSAYDAVQDKKEFDNLEAREAAGEKLTQEESVRRNELNQMFNQDMSNPESYMFENLDPSPPSGAQVNRNTESVPNPESHMFENLEPRKTSSVGGGRGVIDEQPGERAAYLASLEVSNNSTRQNGLNTVASNNNAAVPVIINAPVSAPSSVNVSNGGSSVNQLSISGGGGGSLGPSMLPYGLTNAFS